MSLSIPKDRNTAFVGVSGSGKSSLVFDTIAVEAQRQLYATFPPSIRNQLPRHERPEVDAIENLTTPVVVDQRPLTGNARSTVGTITDIYSMMRVLFARFGEPSSGLPSLYSFNDPKGMCPECEGLGRSLRVDPDFMLDKTKSLEEGAILVPGYPVCRRRAEELIGALELSTFADRVVRTYSGDRSPSAVRQVAT